MCAAAKATGLRGVLLCAVQSRCTEAAEPLGVVCMAVERGLGEDGGGHGVGSEQPSINWD